LKKIGTVVCGGIEDEYYQYLKWKNVKVLDSVIGSYKDVIKQLEFGTLQSGDIIRWPGYFTCARRSFAPIAGFPLHSNKASRAQP
jgi:predicted Fe-Mo cluster-binding NifX family protein